MDGATGGPGRVSRLVRGHGQCEIIGPHTFPGDRPRDAATPPVFLPAVALVLTAGMLLCLPASLLAGQGAEAAGEPARSGSTSSRMTHDEAMASRSVRSAQRVQNSGPARPVSPPVVPRFTTC